MKKKQCINFLQEIISVLIWSVKQYWFVHLLKNIKEINEWYIVLTAEDLYNKRNNNISRQVYAVDMTIPAW